MMNMTQTTAKRVEILLHSSRYPVVAYIKSSHFVIIAKSRGAVLVFGHDAGIRSGCMIQVYRYAPRLGMGNVSTQ